jgi:hypothetical protein
MIESKSQNIKNVKLFVHAIAIKVKKAALLLGINYSTAKSILSVYRKDGRRLRRLSSRSRKIRPPKSEYKPQGSLLCPVSPRELGKLRSSFRAPFIIDYDLSSLEDISETIQDVDERENNLYIFSPGELETLLIHIDSSTQFV